MHTSLFFANHTQYFRLGANVCHNQNTIVGELPVIPEYQQTNLPEEFHAVSLNSKS